MISDAEYEEIKVDRRRGEDVLRHLYRVIEERETLKAEVERLKDERDELKESCENHKRNVATLAAQLGEMGSRVRDITIALEERDEARAVACRLWRDCTVKNVLRLHEEHRWLLEED